MKEIYKVNWVKDNEYEIIEIETDTSVFHGNLEEVNAWLSLKEKGYFN